MVQLDPEEWARSSTGCAGRGDNSAACCGCQSHVRILAVAPDAPITQERARVAESWMKHPLYTIVALLVLPWIGFLLNTWLGALIGSPLAALGSGFGTWLPVVVSLTLAAIMAGAFMYKREAILKAVGGVGQGRGRSVPNKVVVDTSAVIDGRIGETSQRSRHGQTEKQAQRDGDHGGDGGDDRAGRVQIALEHAGDADEAEGSGHQEPERR